MFALNEKAVQLSLLTLSSFVILSWCAPSLTVFTPQDSILLKSIVRPLPETDALLIVTVTRSRDNNPVLWAVLVSPSGVPLTESWRVAESLELAYYERFDVVPFTSGFTVIYEKEDTSRVLQLLSYNYTNKTLLRQETMSYTAATVPNWTEFFYSGVNTYQKNQFQLFTPIKTTKYFYTLMQQDFYSGILDQDSDLKLLRETSVQPRGLIACAGERAGTYAMAWVQSKCEKCTNYVVAWTQFKEKATKILEDSTSADRNNYVIDQILYLYNNNIALLVKDRANQQIHYLQRKKSITNVINATYSMLNQTSMRLFEIRGIGCVVTRANASDTSEFNVAYDIYEYGGKVIKDQVTKNGDLWFFTVNQGEYHATATQSTIITYTTPLAIKMAQFHCCPFQQNSSFGKEESILESNKYDVQFSSYQHLDHIYYTTNNYSFAQQEIFVEYKSTFGFKIWVSILFQTGIGDYEEMSCAEVQQLASGKEGAASTNGLYFPQSSSFNESTARFKFTNLTPATHYNFTVCTLEAFSLMREAQSILFSSLNTGYQQIIATLTLSYPIAAAKLADLACALQSYLSPNDSVTQFAVQGVICNMTAQTNLTNDQYISKLSKVKLFAEGDPTSAQDFSISLLSQELYSTKFLEDFNLNLSHGSNGTDSVIKVSAVDQVQEIKNFSPEIRSITIKDNEEHNSFDVEVAKGSISGYIYAVAVPLRHRLLHESEPLLTGDIIDSYNAGQYIESSPIHRFDIVAHETNSAEVQVEGAINDYDLLYFTTNENPTPSAVRTSAARTNFLRSSSNTTTVKEEEAEGMQDQEHNNPDNSLSSQSADSNSHPESGTLSTDDASIPNEGTSKGSRIKGFILAIALTMLVVLGVVLIACIVAPRMRKRNDESQRAENNQESPSVMQSVEIMPSRQLARDYNMSNTSLINVTMNSSNIARVADSGSPSDVAGDRLDSNILSELEISQHLQNRDLDLRNRSDSGTQLRPASSGSIQVSQSQGAFRHQIRPIRQASNVSQFSSNSEMARGPARADRQNQPSDFEHSISNNSVRRTRLQNNINHDSLPIPGHLSVESSPGGQLHAGSLPQHSFPTFQTDSFSENPMNSGVRERHPGNDDRSSGFYDGTFRRPVSNQRRNSSNTEFSEARVGRIVPDSYFEQDLSSLESSLEIPQSRNMASIFSLAQGTAVDASIGFSDQRSSIEPLHSRLNLGLNSAQIGIEANEAKQTRMEQLKSTDSEVLIRKVAEMVTNNEKTSEPDDKGVSISPSDLLEIQKQLKKLKDIKSEQESSKLCSICFTNKKDTMLENCGHVTCDNCALNLKKCPFCKARIRNVKKVFLDI